MTGKPRTLLAPLYLLAVLLCVLFAPPTAGAVTIERVLSPGGIEAWLVRDHTNPIITMRFAFRGGAALDPEGREGLANMVSTLLDEGAGDLDSKTFQGRLEDLVITLRFDAGRDNFGGRLRTLVENKATAFDLLTLALTRPRFDTEPLERIKSQILTSLRQEAEDPNTIAGKTLFKTLFPAHPYGRPVDGTLDIVAAITQTDLKGFVQRRLAKDNLTIGVVGDITADALMTVLDKIFGGLPAKAWAWAIPEAALKGQGRTVVVTKPAPQSAIVFADKGPKRQDPDFYAAYVMNYILGGGGFNSRLYEEVREKRGLAYSVYSYLYTLEHAGLYLGGVATRNDGVRESLDIIGETRNELLHLRRRKTAVGCQDIEPCFFDHGTRIVAHAEITFHGSLDVGLRQAPGDAAALTRLSRCNGVNVGGSSAHIHQEQRTDAFYTIAAFGEQSCPLHHRGGRRHQYRIE